MRPGVFRELLRLGGRRAVAAKNPVGADGAAPSTEQGGGLRRWRVRGVAGGMLVLAGVSLGIALPGALRAAPPQPAHVPGPPPGAPLSADLRFVVGELIASDDFTTGLEQWKVELESGGSVTGRSRALEINVPAGCTVWFLRPLEGPVLITYEATVVDTGGPNDRVSDLNCFWMATDARNPENLLAVPRSGAFADYDELRCYYVGVGGNGNTTTRFRRYIGERGHRPLLPQHDLSAGEFLLAPNRAQRIQLIAAGRSVGFYRDGRRLFSFDDPEPYVRGWFGFRTVHSHLRIRGFKVFRLLPAGRAGNG